MATYATLASFVPQGRVKRGGQLAWGDAVSSGHYGCFAIIRWIGATVCDLFVLRAPLQRGTKRVRRVEEQP